MKHFTFFLLVSALCFGLCACQDSSKTQTTIPLKSGEYAAVLPYSTSDTRGKHIGLISDMDIRIQLEQGLMELSKTYFPPSEVAFRTHVFLDYDELDSTDGSRGLLGTLRDNNPNGLNPSSDEDFDTGTGIVKGPILVLDLYELDFYSGSDLKGIAIGLAVPDEVEEDGKTYSITPEKMVEFVKASATKVVSYLRERFNEIPRDLPILVAAYELNSNASSVSKGGFVYMEYFNRMQSESSEINEEYLLVPSSAFSALEPEMAQEFNDFRQEIARILSDTTFTTGQARLRNGMVQKLTITVSAYGKTVGEIWAVIQSVRENLALFESQSCLYKVIIENNGDVCALMDRDPGTTEVQVLTIY